MGIMGDSNRSSSSATSPCAHFRTAYHNCFNRWYSEKFLKGQWDKEGCISEWEKYRQCLSQHLDDKHLSRFLEADGVLDLTDQAELKSKTGDRYLKPWIIPDPEVMFVPRTRDNDCLILASDGLWDVMTNYEACDLARKRILLWHKSNSVCLPLERGKGIDPAAQKAAEYLSNRALQRGSKDNISIVVVDLKAQRKIKNMT